MHESVQDFVGRHLRPQDITGKRVLEVGSYDVNGSIRPLIVKFEPAEYIGVDMREGPGVDLVLNALDLEKQFGRGLFDLVICAELLEHAQDWRGVITNLKAVLKPGGLLVLTTRSWGFPLHEYPGDFWRFEGDDMRDIFRDMLHTYIETDPQVPGVFVRAQSYTESTLPAVNLHNIAVRSMDPAHRAWAVVIAPLDLDPHAEVFREVAETLRAALQELGHEAVVIGAEAAPNHCRWIVLGAQHAPGLGITIPPDAILYNLEQVGSPWFNASAVALFKRHSVWDYSAANARRFPELGLAVPHVVPFGYHECLERIARKPEEERDIDVLHVGSLNVRRIKILDEIMSRGLRVERLYGVYGPERDSYYARAKVVINIHYYDAAIFEAARVNYCVANGVFVVSETSRDDEGRNLCVCDTYDDLVDTVCSLVKLPSARATAERNAKKTFQEWRMADHVRAALAWRPQPSDVIDVPTQSVVLCMIVKNETKVLSRCLLSVLPHITHWCVVDTGSTDGTQDLVRAFLHGLPGELLEQPWVSEDVNRNQALEAARKLGDYVLWIDADEVLQADEGFTWPELTADAYDITVRYGSTSYARVQLLKSSLPWTWHGRVHPYLEATGSTAPVLMPGVCTIPYPEGASWADPDKYKKHVALLEQDVREHPDNARFRYYLAQSYRDAGDPATARHHYLFRAGMTTGWAEETWSAQYRAAQMAEKLGVDSDILVCEYLEAWRARPRRAEPLHAIARHLNWRGEYAAALMFARQAAVLPMPEDRLFVEADVYQWRALDELTLAAIHAGHSAEAQSAFYELMTRKPGPPASEMPRLLQNAKHIDPTGPWGLK